MITELAAPFDMSFPAVSKHIRVLEEAALVSREIVGRSHRFSLIASPLKEAEQWLDVYRSFWEDNLLALEKYVEGKRRK